MLMGFIIFPMYSLCIPYVFPMYSLCIPYVFPRFSMIGNIETVGLSQQPKLWSPGLNDCDIGILPEKLSANPFEPAPASMGH